jgi:hypothetical protein
VALLDDFILCFSRSVFSTSSSSISASSFFSSVFLSFLISFLTCLISFIAAFLSSFIFAFFDSLSFLDTAFSGAACLNALATFAGAQSPGDTLLTTDKEHSQPTVFLPHWELHLLHARRNPHAHNTSLH